MVGYGLRNGEVTPKINEEVSIVEGIASWCSALSGKAPLRHGLRQIAESLDCHAIAMTRLRKDSSESITSVLVDVGCVNGRGAKLTKSFVKAVMGSYTCKAKSGTLWFASMLDRNIDPSLTEYQRVSGSKELVIIPLNDSERHVDLLELHFADKLDTDHLALLNMTVGTLVKTWSGRANGLFADAVLSKMPSPNALNTSLPILHIQNPARLSRCEYRVCLLISYGLQSEVIQEQLQISASTLRSHLRNIYAKTDCASIAELTYALLAKSETTSQMPESRITA